MNVRGRRYIFRESLYVTYFFLVRFVNKNLEMYSSNFALLYILLLINYKEYMFYKIEKLIY